MKRVGIVVSALLAVGVQGLPAAAALESAPAPDGAWHEHREYLAGRWGQTAVTDPLRGRMIVFGGTDGFRPRSDVWSLRLSPSEDPVWTPIIPLGEAPLARAGHTAIYDPVRDRMIIFGGTDGSGYFDDAWALSLDGTQEWTPMTPTGNIPPGRCGHTAIYDPTADRMIVFGGASGDGAPLDDVWSLSLGGGIPTWVRLFPSGHVPARFGHVAIHDVARHRMVVFGGGDGLARNDAWALQLSPTLIWTELTTSGPRPAARSGHAAVHDPARDRMVLFGGSLDGVVACMQIANEPPDLDNTYALDLATNTWSQLASSGPRPDGRLEHTAVFDGVSSRMIVFGGNGNAMFNDTWSLSLGPGIAPAWTMLTPSGVPPVGTGNVAAVYDSDRGRVVVQLGGTAGGERNDTFALSLSDPIGWTQIATHGEPPSPRVNHTGIYDPLCDRMIIFGGANSLGGPPAFDDTWVLRFEPLPEWTPLQPDGPVPLPRASHSAIYDPLGHRMVVFGGGDGIANGGSYNDTWALDLGTCAWYEMTPGGSRPAPRNAHKTIYDPVRHRMIVFGGLVDHVPTNEVWSLSLAGNGQWTRLFPSGAPPVARREHTSVYDPVRDRMVVFAGHRDGDAQHLNDAWALSLAGAPAWSRLDPTGSSPLPRLAHAAVYDPVEDRMVVFGGWDWIRHHNNQTFDLRWADPPINRAQSALLTRPSAAICDCVTDAESVDGSPRAAALRMRGRHPLRLADPLELEVSVPTPGGTVRLTLHDAGGRHVAEIADRFFEPGAHSMTWNPSVGFAAGVYFVRMATSGGQDVQRTVFVR